MDNNLTYENGVNVGKKIIKLIQNSQDYAFKNAPFNMIRVGLITKKVGKTFTIKINQSNYSNIYALKGSGEINVGDTAICVIPNNQFSQMFILGVLDME